MSWSPGAEFGNGGAIPGLLSQRAFFGVSFLLCALGTFPRGDAHPLTSQASLLRLLRSILRNPPCFTHDALTNQQLEAIKDS
jgi:hypothetical protein